MEAGEFDCSLPHPDSGELERSLAGVTVVDVADGPGSLVLAIPEVETVEVAPQLVELQVEPTNGEAGGGCPPEGLAGDGEGDGGWPAILLACVLGGVGRVTRAGLGMGMGLKGMVRASEGT